MSNVTVVCTHCNYVIIWNCEFDSRSYRTVRTETVPSGRIADVSAANEQDWRGCPGVVLPSIAIFRRGVDIVEWIPVDKKAPEVGQRIICTGVYLGLFVGYYRGTDIVHQCIVRHLASLMVDSVKTREFVAWMPAPEPYKGRERHEKFMAISAAYYQRPNKRERAVQK